MDLAGKLVAAGRDPWLQSGLDFGTSEIQYFLYILHIEEEHHANFESICWYLPSPSRLRGVAPTATRDCSTQQWHSPAIGTGYTGARGRDSPHAGARYQTSIFLVSLLEYVATDIAKPPALALAGQFFTFPIIISSTFCSFVSQKSSKGSACRQTLFQTGHFFKQLRHAWIFRQNR